MLSTSTVVIRYLGMGFQAYEETSVSFPEVPFLSDFPQKKKYNGTLFAVQSIFLSDKGIMAFTSAFKVFIWKSEKLHNELLEKIGSTLSHETPMDCFSVLLDSDVKKGFVTGFDDSIRGFWNEDGRNYQFDQITHVPSNPPIEGLDVPKDIDTSPQTGRKAR